MNKKFPSSKKDIKKTLTHWSAWVILGTTAFLWGIQSAWAGISNYTVPSTLPYPAISDCINCNNTVWPKPMVISTPTTCNHASGIVNGHYSNIPSVNSTTETINLFSHASHSSSGSGGGGGWC